MEATTRKIASYMHAGNVKKLVIKTIYQPGFALFNKWSYLLFRTDPDDIHSLFCCMIFLRIIHSIQLYTLRLIEIVVYLRITKLKLLSILEVEIGDTFSYAVNQQLLHWSF